MNADCPRARPFPEKAPPAAIANAVCDALAPYQVEINTTPIRPELLVRETGQA